MRPCAHRLGREMAEGHGKQWPPRGKQIRAGPGPKGARGQGNGAVVSTTAGYGLDSSAVGPGPTSKRADGLSEGSPFLPPAPGWAPGGSSSLNTVPRAGRAPRVRTNATRIGMGRPNRATQAKPAATPRGHPDDYSSAIRRFRYSHFMTTLPCICMPRGAAPENFGSLYSEAFLRLIQQVNVSPLA
jgi:hypothetical protein